jgi:hypothetical protein
LRTGLRLAAVLRAVFLAAGFRFAAAFRFGFAGAATDAVAASAATVLDFAARRGLRLLTVFLVVLALRGILISSPN